MTISTPPSTGRRRWLAGALCTLSGTAARPLRAAEPAPPGAPPAVPAVPADLAELLRVSDTARGGGFPGIVWRVKLQAVDGDKVDQQGLTVKTDGSSSLAEFFAPANIAGQKLLMANRNMWFVRQGLRKPVPISPRQRLIGQASNGDIAATNYSADYTPARLADDMLDREACAVLDLSGRNDQVTYPKIRLWVAAGRRVALKAEFYSLSDKLIKTARFEYGNTVSHQGRRLPFVSRMVIQDQINAAQQTTLEYTDVQVREIPRREFDINFLAGG